MLLCPAPGDQLVHPLMKEGGKLFDALCLRHLILTPVPLQPRGNTAPVDAVGVLSGVGPVPQHGCTHFPQKAVVGAFAGDILARAHKAAALATFPGDIQRSSRSSRVVYSSLQPVGRKCIE